MGIKSRRYLSRLLVSDTMSRHGFFLFALVVSISYLLSGFPFAPLFDDAVVLRSGFRIVFGVVFLASLYQTRNAIPILYGYDAVRQTDGNRRLFPSYHLQFVLVALLIVGFLTEVVALLLLAVRIVFIQRTRRFGLENTLYQMVIVHLPFLDVGAVYSVDAVIGTPSLIASPTMFNSLFVLCGIMTISGAHHKLHSEMWQDGQAVKEFLALPHLRLSLLRDVSLPVTSRLSVLLSFTTVLGQSLLLFSVVNKWLFLAVCLVFAGFSLSLFTIIDLSFIGQAFLAVFGLYGGAVVLNLSSYSSLSTVLSLSVTPFTPLAILINVLGLLMVLQNDYVTGRLRTVSKLVSGQNAPIKPFNKHHMRGIHTFRFLYEDPDTGSRRPVLEVFDEDGWQKQFFHPRYFQASVYVVTDYCLAINHDGISSSEKESEVIDLCCAALYSAGKDQGKIHLQIKVFDGDLETYVSDEWQTIGVCRFGTDDAEWELVEAPPQFDTHPRLEFDYDNS